LLTAYPANGDIQQPLTTRITLFFSDEIDLNSISAESIVVRPLNGDPVDGVFSHSSFNAVSFGAKADLSEDTTYEVVIVKDGLKDLAQNPIAEPSVIRFSTGATVDAPVGSGGSGGASSTAGGQAGGSAGMPGTSAGSDSGGTAPTAGMASGGTSTASAGMGVAGTAPAEGAESGCGCELPGQSRAPATWALLGLAALVAARSRRDVRRVTLRS
jgi:MYXO-CTERM domain-containing protein